MDPLWILLIGMLVVVGGVLALRLHAFLALILGALVVASITPIETLEQYTASLVKKQEMTGKQAAKFIEQSVGERVAIEFGNTCGKIGVLIALASIIGKCLLDSGGADRIVRSALKLFGEERAPLAFLSSGFVLGIPVFFDTVFYLMIPLGKAMRMRTGKNYLLYVLTICAGATMTHSLVPPTPGPLAVANQLGVDMGLMILGGCIVGAICSVFGYLWALFANRRWDVPLRASADVSLEELEALSRRDESELPPLWLSLMPILLPVVLISGKTGFDMWRRGVKSEELTQTQQILERLANDLGNSNIAVAISAAIAMGTLIWIRHTSLKGMSHAVQDALASAGEIILITSAGGAFGGVLQQTGIAERIHQLAPESSAAIVPMAFLVTTLIRTAQGSATVAMITAAGILLPLVESAGCHPLYIALAIGCGSKPFTWMNDSGFWVICKMSGMTEVETLKAVTPLTAIMGFVGLGVTTLGAWLWPWL
jgi:GntP family gluconate:H+ symporter